MYVCIYIYIYIYIYITHTYMISKKVCNLKGYLNINICNSLNSMKVRLLFNYW